MPTDDFKLVTADGRVLKTTDELSGKKLALNDFEIKNESNLDWIPWNSHHSGKELHLDAEGGELLQFRCSDLSIEHVQWHIYDLTGIHP